MWVISCHVIATYCKLQPCRRSSVPTIRVFGVPQPLPGDFRSIDVITGWLPVTWGHVISFPVTWLPPPASYGTKRVQRYSEREFSAFCSFEVSSSQMTSFPGDFRSVRSHDVVSCYVPALPASCSPVGAQTYTKREFCAFYSHFQVTYCQMTTLPSHFLSCEDKWHHFLSRDCHLLRVAALYKLKRTQNATSRPSIATSRWLPVKWRHILVISSDVSSCDVLAEMYIVHYFRHI